MIGQLKVLLRVKQLKEEQAFRAVRAKRQQLAEAERKTAEARRIEDESRRSLPAREDAIYREIFGQVIDLGVLDDTRGKVLELEREHGKLVDGVERATHVEARVKTELETETQRHRKSLKERDKYVILHEEVRQELVVVADAREEGEVEDLFGSRKRKVPS
jgi:hypothetical protein